MSKRKFTECHNCGALRLYRKEKDKEEICGYCGVKTFDIEVDIKGEDQWREAREKEIYEQYIAGDPQKEKLCEERKKEEAEELQRIIAEMKESYRKSREERFGHLAHCPRCGSGKVKKVDATQPGYTCSDCGNAWQ